MRPPHAVTLAIALALAGAPAAAASSATLVYEAPIPELEIDAAYALAVQAGDGEANRITVRLGDGAYVVTDTGAPLRPREGCVPVSAGEVRCAMTLAVGDRSVFVDAGDGDDQVALRDLGADTVTEVRGGPGRDLLFGGDGHDLLLGGAGDDGLLGGGGFDRLDGGAGDDVRDRVSYQRRRRPVTVDLAEGTGGARGERDLLIEVEEVVGGRAADVLRGSAGADTLIGGEGPARDRAHGRGGDDVVIAYQARGGAGNDSVDGRHVACGRGFDALYRGTHRAPGPFPRDCEQLVAVFAVLRPHPLRASRRTVVFGVRCHDRDRCRGALRLRDRRGVLGQRRFDIRRGSDPAALHRVRIRLSRRPVRRVGTLRIDGVRAYQRSSFRVRLR